MSLLGHYIKILFSYTPRLAYQLSDKSLLKALSLILNLWFFIVTRKTLLRGKSKKFHFKYKDRQFFLELDSVIDVAVLAEVFVLREYEWELDYSVQTVLDLGAHWGDSSVYYAMEYPEAKIFAVEPTPGAFERLNKLVVQFPNIVPIRGALGSVTGEQKLFVSKSTLGNSLTKRSENNHAITVNTFDFKSLCEQAGVGSFDLVKFDIEGAEKYIFENPEIKNYSRGFIGEIHLDLMDVTLGQIKKYFSGHDMTLNKINDSRYIVKSIIRKTSLT